MIYHILKFYVGFLLKLFIKDLKVTGMERVPQNRAVLFAAFHSNSFLDAIILDILVEKPIWSLARGDAFKKPVAAWFLKQFYMLPIFRQTEGRENMHKNDETFERCAEVFRNKGQVQIYSEGLCRNQTQLLSLKKGTARLALQSWSSGIEVDVVPVAINYSNFTGIGKKVLVSFGKPITAEAFENPVVSGANIQQFNDQLKSAFGNLIRSDFNFKTFHPIYTIGRIINFPVYYFLTIFTRLKTKGTVFFDSIYLALMIIVLPLYWILLFFIIKFVFL